MSIPLLDLAWQIFFSNFLAPKIPYKMTFALTYCCDAKCKYCNTWARTKKQELGFDQIKTIIDSASRLRWLHLTGGEIFLRDDIEKILRFLLAKQKLALLTFATNGLSPDRVTSILKNAAKDLGKTRLIITCSLDGTETVHDRLRGARGAYGRCLETFLRLRSMRGIDACLGVTVSNDNYHELPSLVSELERKIPGFCFEELHFNFIHSSFFYNHIPSRSFETNLDPEAYAVVDRLRKAHGQGGRRIKVFLETRYFEFLRFYVEERHPPLKCSASEGSCLVDPYGDVYACIGYEKKIGNLASAGYNFEQFWELFARERNIIGKLIQEHKCPGCWTSCEAYPTILSNLWPQMDRNGVVSGRL